MVSPAPDPRTVFVSRFNRVLAIALWVIVAALLAAGVANGHDWHRWLGLVPAAFGGLLGWTALWHPRLVVDDDGVEVVNVFHTADVPWAALVHVDTRFALTLVTPHRKIAAWAAPAPGRAGVALARRRNQRHGRVGLTPTTAPGERSAGDLLSTESGDAAYLVREHWDGLRESGRIELGVADTVAVPVRLHVVTIALLVATGVGGWFAIAAQ
ncbi:PH domain-containing protein [Curtobacterium sp. MCBD17_035]|uniref:PH domain-containing protein n=1 Tax=Curtobacterium sp. MCBD17_035 TaxID=2175673 RepID=UPI000DA9E7BD|nr:PH domain-containing protein [Curtobacterium sp. MCBD17_035]WIB66715.1 PH domain-containing protein [Curtobacterium sp. MCBD17_035]